MAMFVETITANVVRFPIELREASLLTLGAIEPDLREIDVIAEAFGLDAPDPDLTGQAELDCLDELSRGLLPEDKAMRQALLRRIEEAALRPAIAACRQARQSAWSAAELQARADVARTSASANAGFFSCLAEDAAKASAEQMLTAFRLAQRARGVSRVIGFALNGQSWKPFDIQAETDWLIAAGPARLNAA
jgi:hypothetical protein